jgi:RimJ/RimL family protein N-acetyltransferase
MTIFLETKRLILKAPQISDLDNLIALRTDFDVMTYIRDGNIQTNEEVQEFLDTAIPYQEKHGIGFCSVFEKDSGEFVGQAGLLHLAFDDTQPNIEVGVRLHKKFWGKGYATELATCLIEWGFKHLSVNKLIAVIHPGNKASQKAALKAGFDKKDEKFLYREQEVFLFEIYKNKE